jgi:hypothetical protein
MKRNGILAGAVVLALTGAGTAIAAQSAEECSKEAVRLTAEVGKSKVTDTAKAELTTALNDAKGADLARCEQVLSRVRREIGLAPEESAAADATSANLAMSESAGYEAGHASADESLPKHPGAAANDSSSPSVSASGDAEQGYASASETMDGEPAKSSTTDYSTDYATANRDATATATGEDDRDATAASTGEDYQDGHASAGESLPSHPGAAANDSSNAGMSTSGDLEQGTASANETLKSITVPARADTGSNQLSTWSTKDLIDKSVKSPAGTEGTITAIVRDKTADENGYAVIGYGGVFGVGEKQALVGIDQLKVAEDGSIQLPASDPKEFTAYPPYMEEDYETYDGAIAQIL